MKIIIVDDNKLNLYFMSSVLKDEGLEISTACDGEEALEKIQDIKPDIIFLDIVMPGLNGYEVCRKLKKIENTCQIPVIFISGRRITIHPSI